MIKHVVIWKFKDSLKDVPTAAIKIKRELEALVGIIPGLVSAKVYIKPLESSNGSIMLDSTLLDEASYTLYKNHPVHIEAATFVRSVIAERVCFDSII